MRCSRNSQMALVQRGLPCYALMEEFHQSPRFLPVGLHLLDGSEILPQAWFEADQAFSSAPCSGTEASVRECAESQPARTSLSFCLPASIGFDIRGFLPAASSELQVAADTQVSPVFLMGCPAALLTEDWILPSRSLRPVVTTSSRAASLSTNTQLHVKAQAQPKRLTHTLDCANWMAWATMSSFWGSTLPR